MKKFLSLLMALLMTLSVVQCLSVVSFAAGGTPETEPNDSKSNATKMKALDSVYTGRLSNRNDVDWYSFTIPSDIDYFNVIFKANENNKYDVNDGWDVILYKSGMDDVLKTEKGNTGYRYESPNLPYKGTFYIKIEANNKSSDDAPTGAIYDLKIETHTGDKWENELNNTKSNSMSIKTDATYSGVTTNRNDVDWYKFTIANDVDYFNVIFEANEHNPNDTSDGWNVSIYKSGTDDPLKIETGNTGYQYISPNLPYKGTFYIKVEANNKSESEAPIDCYYDLKIETHAGDRWENEFNNSKSNAMSIKNDTAYSGVTMNRTDVDWYKFVIGKDNCYFNVLFQSNRFNKGNINDGWTISIYKSGIDNALQIVKENTGYLFKSRRFTAPSTYYVKVEPTNKSVDSAPIDCYYDLKVATVTSHSYKTTTTKATADKDGKIETACKYCGKVTKTVAIPKVSTIKLSAASYTYDGKVKTPVLTVRDSKGKDLKKGTDYTVQYSSSRKNPGKYAVKVTFKGNYSGSKTLYFNILPGKTSKIAVSQTATSIKAAWKAVTGASGYQVTLYGSNSKAVKTVYTTKKSYTFSKLTSGTSYKIKVVAYKTIDGKKALSNVALLASTATAPGTPTLKVTAGMKKAALSWNNQNGASGYEIFVKSGNTYKKLATVKGGSSAQYTVSGLKTGSTYSFKVRAYKLVGGKTVYGDYSAVKIVKVK